MKAGREDGWEAAYSARSSHRYCHLADVHWEREAEGLEWTPYPETVTTAVCSRKDKDRAIADGSGAIAGAIEGHYVEDGLRGPAKRLHLCQNIAGWIATSYHEESALSYGTVNSF